MQILVVTGDPIFASFLQRTLEEEKLLANIASSEYELRQRLRAEKYAVVVLDVQFADDDYIPLLRIVRRATAASILLSTPRDKVADRIKGLSEGVDEYLIKPFAVGNLLAKVRTLGRRDQPVAATSFKIADLEVNLVSRVGRRGEMSFLLSIKENALLLLLQSSRGVVPTAVIAEQLWDCKAESNVVETTIRRLRRKIDDPHELKLLHTVRGIGYLLRDKTLA